MRSGEPRSIPRRIARRALTAVSGSGPDHPPVSAAASHAAHGDWLESVHGEALAAIERACADPDDGRLALFRGLDTDTWALLLTQEHDRYPNIRALLPSVPDPALQTLYNGRSGVPLALQSKDFYERVRTRFAEHSRALARGLARAGLRLWLGPADALLRARRGAGQPVRLRPRPADPGRVCARRGARHARADRARARPDPVRRDIRSGRSASRSSPTSPRRRTWRVCGRSTPRSARAGC